MPPTFYVLRSRRGKENLGIRINMQSGAKNGEVHAACARTCSQKSRTYVPSEPNIKHFTAQVKKQPRERQEVLFYLKHTSRNWQAKTSCKNGAKSESSWYILKDLSSIEILRSTIECALTMHIHSSVGSSHDNGQLRVGRIEKDIPLSFCRWAAARILYIFDLPH